jgi:branched-chain amino acid transport system substrate-binding protein
LAVKDSELKRKGKSMRFTKRSTFLILLAAALFVPAAVLLINRQPAPLTIGFIGGLTGKAADLGVDCRRGAELAVARINEQGGINGRPVELLVKDDGHNEALARAAVAELLAAEVPVIIGHTTSAMTMATLPIINKSSTLLVSPTTSTPLLSDIDDNLIRSCTVSTTAATTMARYLRERVDARRAGVIYDLGNQAYTEQWYHSFRETFLGAGGDIVQPFPFTSDPGAQLLPLVEQMRGHDFDVLVVVANSVDAAMICQQVRKIDWDIQLALSDWSATEQLLSLGGRSVEGAVISQFFNRKSSSPSYRDFKHRFEQVYQGDPGFGALHAFNAVMLVGESMNSRGPNESIKEAVLRHSTFPGLQGDIVINRYGDASHPTFMGVINNGDFVILEDFR